MIPFGIERRRFERATEALWLAAERQNRWAAGMKVSGLLVVALLSPLLIPAVTRALPGAELGTSCDRLLRRELARGATVTYRDTSPPGLIIRLKSQFKGHPMEAIYACDEDSITRQFVVIDFSNETDSIHLFQQLRAEVESKFGEPHVDGTSPDQLESLRELDPDPDSVERRFRFYVMWFAKGVEQSLSVSQIEERWAVTFSSRIEPAAQQIR